MYVVIGDSLWYLNVGSDNKGNKSEFGRTIGRGFLWIKKGFPRVIKFLLMEKLSDILVALDRIGLWITN